MLTRSYIYACSNWQMVLAVLVVSIAAVAFVATRLQVSPQPMLVAINWENRIVK